MKKWLRKKLRVWLGVEVLFEDLIRQSNNLILLKDQFECVTTM